MKISVLLSLYIKELPAYLHECLESLSIQSFSADEIVIVFDGPVTTDLELCVNEWSKRLPIKIVRIDRNVGLGEALNFGISSCSHDYIFRMDTDDICHKDRFKRQVDYLISNPNVGLLSSTIGEFRESQEKIHAFRKLPLTHKEIVNFARKRNPFNHMAIVFRKKDLKDAGGYQREYLYEDYALWVRMIQNGVITANLPDVLVFARTGNGMASRRSGLQYAKSEYNAQQRFYKSGFINFFEFTRNLAIRLPLRLMPTFLLSFLYATLLRK